MKFAPVKIYNHDKFSATIIGSPITLDGKCVGTITGRTFDYLEARLLLDVVDEYKTNDDGTTSVELKITRREE